MDFQRALTAIMNKANNRTCADCSTKNPRWVSISLGVFVCIRCCGVHRNLGTHISKMKSVTRDKWQPDWVRIFDQLDNEVANRYWERGLPANFRKPHESSTTYEVESFIRDKYEFKRWVADGEPDPVSAVLTGKAKVQKQEVPAAPKVVEVTPKPVPMVDLLAVEPVPTPKQEEVLNWPAQSISFPQTAQPARAPAQPQVSKPSSIFQPPTSQSPPFQPPTSQAPPFQAPSSQPPTFQTPISQPPPFQAPIFQPPTQVAPKPVQSYPDNSRESNIRNIMSMYGQVSQSQAPAQQPAFVPLGAIAAERMFKGGPGYQAAQQWPSF